MLPPAPLEIAGGQEQGWYLQNGALATATSCPTMDKLPLSESDRLVLLGRDV